MNKLFHASALALSLIATVASAQAVRTEKNMSLELANQIAAATVASCTAAGYNVAAAVVDRAGTLRALQRADNAGPHTAGRQRKAKAYTSASAKNTTSAMMEACRRTRPAANTGVHPRLPAAGRRRSDQGRQRSHRRGRRRRRAGRPSGREMRDGRLDKVKDLLK